MDVMLRDDRRQKGTSKLEINVAFHVYEQSYASEVHFNIAEGVTLHAVRQRHFAECRNTVWGSIRMPARGYNGDGTSSTVRSNRPKFRISK